jgi:hypothetical protein
MKDGVKVMSLQVIPLIYYRLDDRGVDVRFPLGEKQFSLSP